MPAGYDWQALHRDAPARAEPESLIAYLRGPADTTELHIRSDLPAMHQNHSATRR